MAKRRSTPGTRQFACEMDEALLEEFARFADERGETKRQVVEQALRRHLAYPPPPPAPPPVMPFPAAAAKPKKK